MWDALFEGLIVVAFAVVILAVVIAIGQDVGSVAAAVAP